MAGRAFSLQPSKGVFFPFDLKSAASTTYSFSVSRITRSASAPGLRVPLVSESPRMRAGVRSIMAVPYGNLATMHRHLGQDEQAEKYLQKASRKSETLKR